MGFCNEYDYYGPDWATSWPSGSKAGSGVPLVPHSPDEQWDASVLTLGPISTWAGTNGVWSWDEKASGAIGFTNVVDEGGRLGIRFHQDDWPQGGVWPQWRMDPHVGVTGGCWIMAVTFLTPHPVNNRYPLGNNATANRGMYWTTDTSHNSETGIVVSGTKLKQVNRSSRVDSNPIVDVNTADAHIMIGHDANRIWNALGNLSSANGDNMMNGVVHELLYWHVQPGTAEVQEVFEYLNEKWGFGL